MFFSPSGLAWLYDALASNENDWTAIIKEKITCYRRDCRISAQREYLFTRAHFSVIPLGNTEHIHVSFRVKDDISRAEEAILISSHLGFPVSLMFC